MKKSVKKKSPKQENSKQKATKKAKVEQEDVKAKKKTGAKSTAKSPLLNKDKDKEKSKEKNKKQPVREKASKSSKKAKKPAKVKEIIEEVLDDLVDEVVEEGADTNEEKPATPENQATQETDVSEAEQVDETEQVDEDNIVSQEQVESDENETNQGASDEVQLESQESLINQIEALVFSSSVPLSVDKIIKTFDENKPTLGEVRECLLALAEHYQPRGVNLVEVATGWRFEVARDCAPTIVKTMTEKPTRLSRAFLETLALIAYRQPITRAEIEAIRGVVVSTQMIKTLLDHEWIRVVGHKDVPGKPALYATTKTFLDDMGLQKLDDLPPLAEIKAMLPNESKTNQDVSLQEITQQMADIKIESDEIEVKDFSEFIKVDVSEQQRVEVTQDEMNLNLNIALLDEVVVTDDEEVAP